MSQITPASPRPRERWVRLLAIVAAALVPAAFAGLTIAALSDSDAGIDRIPAAIVNQDELVYQTASDGTQTPVIAGRLLVTELTGPDSPGLDWQLLNAEQAEEALASGEVYAVLTIPSEFSASVVSLSSDSPVQAQLTLSTDDAHSYLAGVLAESLGDGMVRTFGSQLTEQYIAGMYTQFGTVGDSFATAADGAEQLADGAEQLSDGIGQLADGVDELAEGAGSYATGVTQYTNGVSELSAGLTQLKNSTSQLGELGAGVKAYTDGISQLTAALSAATQDLASNPTDADKIGAVLYLSNELATAAAQGTSLGAGANGLSELETGIAQSAQGAAQLAANGTSIASGATGIASGASELATGADQLASAAPELSSGATELATGLRSGADQLNGAEDGDTDTAAAVAADPIGLTVTTDNAVTQLGQIIGTYLVPLGLWAGAVAVFLVFRQPSRRVLASTASSARVIGTSLLRAGAVAAAQALLLVLLLHLLAGVSWSLLPATAALALVTAVAFAAFHQLLTIGLGRAGLLISLLLLSLQIAAVGWVLPSEALAGPFSWLGAALPLGWATTGLQQIVSGGDAGLAVASALALAAFGVLAVLVSLLMVRRTRRASALGMLLPKAALRASHKAA